MGPAGASRVIWDFEFMGHGKALPGDGKIQTESWQGGSGRISHITPQRSAKCRVPPAGLPGHSDAESTARGWKFYSEG